MNREPNPNTNRIHLRKSNENTKIWIYLYFPKLALDSQLVHIAEQADKFPLAIISQNQQIKRIYCCNTEATKYGIEEQMSLSTALALCPNLQTRNREADREKYHLERLAFIVHRFSPTVVLYDQVGLSLEISNCKKLYRSYDNLLRQLYLQVSKYSSTVTNGIGHSLLSARLNYNPNFQTSVPSNNHLIEQLGTIKLKELELSHQQQENLEQLGLRTVNEILELPRAAISQRFGHELISQLDLLTGKKPDAYKLFIAPDKFSDFLENPDGIYNKEALYAPMKELLKRFCDYLEARHYHCREINWHFLPLIGNPKSMRIELSSADNSGNSFLSLSTLKLEQLELPYSIEKVLLESNKFTPAPEKNLDLFDVKNRSRRNLLIDQITAKLGVNSLSQPCTYAEYLPEHASSMLTVQSLEPLSDHQDFLRPLWLFNNPIPAKIHNTQLFFHQPLTILSGPERLCDNWWQSDQQRDYYLAHDVLGSRYWIYRDSQSKHWFIHGLFA